MSPQQSILSSAALILASAVLAVVPAQAGWSTDPVTVRATGTPIPVVAACNDGGFGTFVAWQEGAPGGAGVLRVEHLLATGDLDPAWPLDGALACATAVGRSLAGVMPDHAGGVYVWWVQSSGSGLLVTRLDANGEIVAGWPLDGLSLGTVSMRPSAIEDGAGGIYLAWSQGSSVRVHHLGPNGLGAGGWPNVPRTVVPPDFTTTLHFWPDLALGPDGGVFLSWATWSLDTTVVESGMHLRRLTSAGLNSPGWPVQGLSIGPFRPEILGVVPQPPLLDITADGRGGLFLLAGNLVQEDLGFAAADPRLYRLLADGQTAVDWPAEGIPTFAGSYFYDGGGGPESGLRVHPDGLDGAIVEQREFYSDAPAITGLLRFTADGQSSSLLSGVSSGHEVVVKGDGGAYMADFKCCGPSSPYDWPAFIHVDQAGALPGWGPLSEYHHEPMLEWYGDIALASTGDGGVVFFWSQVRDRVGLFARRFNPSGVVTGVAPFVKAFGLDRLRFVRNEGVVARVGLDGVAAKLELFDVAGRRVASRAVKGTGHEDVTLVGTSTLSSGVYFARLASGSRAAFGKIAVAR